VSSAPQGIRVGRYRDMQGRGWHLWVRRGLLALLGLFILAALLNVFGQQASTSRASAPEATLEISAPHTVRGGLLWQSRFTINATQELKQATLVLSRGWLENNTLNTIEPSPLGEGSDDGRLVLTLGHIPRGKDYILFMQLQVNPTNVAWNRPQDVDLLDGSRTIAHIDRAIKVFP
jgi:hypothetical protein